MWSRESAAPGPAAHCFISAQVFSQSRVVRTATNRCEHQQLDAAFVFLLVAPPSVWRLESGVCEKPGSSSGPAVPLVGGASFAICKPGKMWQRERERMSGEKRTNHSTPT